MKSNTTAMRHITIIGGCGFIGSALVRKLLEHDVETVRVFDNLSSGKAGNLPQDARVQLCFGQAKDLHELKFCMRGCDTVFHLAANPDIARAATEPMIDFTNGTLLTQNAVEAARCCGVQRFIYFSGSGVYGENPNVHFHEDYGPLKPISPYGASKLAGEAMVSAYAHMFGITSRVFRFANVVGPRQTHGVGYDFLRKLAADPTILKILGDGTQSKSYIHVDDVLNAVMLVVGMMDQKVPYDVFNVATDDYITVEQIADLAIAISGTNTVKAYTGGDRGWNGDVPKVRFNTSKIKALGWECANSSGGAMTRALVEMKGAACQL